MAKGAYIGVANFTKRNLPIGYTQVEYIQSSGTQYINTGVNAQSGVEFYAEWELTEVPSSSGVAVIGAISNGVRVYPAYSNSGKWGYGYGSYVGSTVSPSAGKKVNIYSKMATGAQTLQIDGETVLSGTIATAYDVAAPLYMFALYNSGNASNYSKSKLYGAKILVNGTLVRDFVPCKNSGGTVGLYDMVNGAFYTNAGSGTFTAGTSTITSVARKIKGGYIGIKNFAKRALPSGYTQVEYIQSGGTQYIDTGFKANNNTRVVMDAQLTSTALAALFGGRTAATSKNYALMVTNSGALRSDYNGSYSQTWSVTLTNRRVIDKNKETTTIDGTSQSYANSAFQCDYNLYLLAMNNAGTIQWQASAKLYSCQIYDNGTLVRDYVPCKNASGTAGMYDMVNATFYANAGTGTFTVGSSVSSVARKIKKAYIGVGGIARLWFGAGEVARWTGGLSTLSHAAYWNAAAAAGNYAIFAGGCYEESPVSNARAYDGTTLTATDATALTAAVKRLSAGSIGSYALFAGGTTDYNLGINAGKNTVNVYDSSLTKSTTTGLKKARLDIGAASNGAYLVFAGGSHGSKDSYGTVTWTALDTVDAYNSSLTRTNPTVLPSTAEYMSGASVGVYAIFAFNGSKTTNVAYDRSLTQTSVTALGEYGDQRAATSVGGYAVFAGGGGNTGVVVNAYNASLTMTTATSLSVYRMNHAAASIGDFALFAGGYTNYSASYFTNTIDTYDSSLTRTTNLTLTNSKACFAGTTAGNYAIFGGGRNTTDNGTVGCTDAFYIK